jgi:ribosomal protein L19
MFALASPDWLKRAADGDFPMNLIQELEKEQFDKLSAGKTIPEFGPGDTVIVNVKVVEGDRSRVQAYEGVCIGRSGGGLNDRLDHRGAPRQGAPRKTVLPAQSARQVGPHRREEVRPRRRRRRVIRGLLWIRPKRGALPRAFLLRCAVIARSTCDEAIQSSLLS